MELGSFKEEDELVKVIYLSCNLRFHEIWSTSSSLHLKAFLSSSPFTHTRCSSKGKGMRVFPSFHLTSILGQEPMDQNPYPILSLEYKSDIILGLLQYLPLKRIPSPEFNSQTNVETWTSCPSRPPMSPLDLDDIAIVLSLKRFL